MTNEVPKDKAVEPAALLECHLTFLDDLRDSADTNMFGARPYLMEEFPELSHAEAKDILIYWMKTFSKRHKQ